MAQQTFREIGMDTMERLYYERKDARQKAYTAKQKKLKKGDICQKNAKAA